MIIVVVELLVWNSIAILQLFHTLWNNLDILNVDDRGGVLFALALHVNVYVNSASTLGSILAHLIPNHFMKVLSAYVLLLTHRRILLYLL